MRIIHLSKYYKPFLGGIETVVADLAEGMNGKDIIVLAASSDAADYRAEKEISGVSVVRSRTILKVASVPIAPKYLLDVIRLSPGSLLHVHMPNPFAALGVWLACAVGRSPARLVLHWHSDVVKQRRLLRLYRPLQNWLLRTADRVIVTSDNYLLHSEPLKRFRCKCVVVPIGVRGIADLVDPEAVASIKRRYKGKPIVFALGRHVYYKGFEFLIDAARSVPDKVFVIGGGGPDTHKYKKRVAELGLQDRVFFIGYVDAAVLPSYFAAADVFAFPSIEKSEAFGVVQLEAMSVGTPVVSTNIKGSGVPWVNQHMVSGLVCAPESGVDLAAALTEILSDPTLHQELSDGARKRFTECFTTEVMLCGTTQVYDSLSPK